MNVLIKNVTILHKGSDLHQKVKDILIQDGIIKKIGDQINETQVRTIEGNRLMCCIGLCDIGTQGGEPGFEHRETMNSLTSAALAGGYTTLALFPNNKPVTQTKADIHFLTYNTDNQGVQIIPIGALSKDTKGIDIAEYMDMASAGVKVFGDGMKSVQDTGLMNRALQYTQQFGGIILHHPDDLALSHGAEMHEGVTSTQLGMKGVSDLSELLTVKRDILLNEYNDGNLIFHAISAKRSIDTIRIAKENQQNLWCTVAYLNLLLTDEDLHDFDSNLKVLPVLRSEDDKKSLIQGLKDGTIDAIVSNHTPLDEESKNVEFPYATPGATGLETCLSFTINALKSIVQIDDIIDKMTTSPRKLLDIAIPEIKEGQRVNLCVFDLEHPHQFNQFHSKSKNNPFIGHDIDIKVIETLIG